MSDKIVIKKIEVIAPELTVEAGLGGINLSKILSNVQEATGGKDTTAKPKDQPAPTADKSSSKKFQVDDFYISKAKVHVNITELKGKGVDQTLDDIHLTNLGSGPEGVTAGELTEIVLAALTKEAKKVVDQQMPELSQKVSEATGLSTNQVNQIGKGLNDLLKKK